MIEELQHVYWIGGGSGAGKSTIAQYLADKHGFKIYATDDVMADHVSRSTEQDCPQLFKFKAMDMEERWVNRDPQLMLDTFHWFQGEAFNLIIEDLHSLPKDQKIVVEGFRLLPHLVKPHLPDTKHAVWLLPTPQFRARVFERRGPEWGFLSKVSNPKKALSNLLERDHMFTRRLHQETEELSLPSIEVTECMSEKDTLERVMEVFSNILTEK